MADEDQDKGSSAEQEEEQAQDEMRKLEEDPPEKLEDWPDGRSKYVTFGGPEGDHSYEEGPEAKLGPSSLERHEDGSITIEGEEVDDPDEHKMESILESGDAASQTGGDSSPSDEEDGD
jgi:hypothetical protein